MKRLFSVLVVGAILLFATLAYAADVILEWDANTEPDLAGYYVYQAEKIGPKTTAWVKITPDLITVATFTVTGLDHKNYAWQVTAVDAEGEESFVSNMVERYDRTPPTNPKNLREIPAP